LINEQKRDPNFKLESWQQISIKKDIRQTFHLGQVLGMGSFGVIREAVYIRAVMHHFGNRNHMKAKYTEVVDPWDYTVCM